MANPLFRLAPLSVACFAAWGGGPIAHAEGRPAPQEAELPTVSITAKGYAASDLDTPISQTLLTRERLLHKQAFTPGDALRGEAGLSVASDGPAGHNPVIRGLRRESLVLLVDGMRLNSAQPQGAIASFMSLGLADQIEVVKGPSSVLYGTGALGGAINVRLPQAAFKPGLAFNTALSHDSASQGWRATGVLNAANERHALMLGASLARSGDYRAPDGKVPQSGNDSDAAIAQYRFRLDASKQVRASLQRQTDEDAWYPGSKKAHPNAAVVGNTIVHAPRQQRTLMELGYEQKGVGQLPLNFDVRAWRQEVERLIWSRSDKLQRDIGQTQVTFATDGLDARADWLAHPDHLLSFGVNAWRMQASPERYLASPTPKSPLVRNDPFKDGELKSLGFHLQDDMRLGAWQVLAGLRHDRVEGQAAAMARPNGQVTTGLRRQDSAHSGSLGLIYEWTPRVRPFVNISRGFRAGELRERFEVSPRGDGYQYIGDPQIRPEHATQVELGLKGGQEGDQPGLSYTVSYHRNRITDLITGRPTGAVVNGLPVKQTVNLGQAVIQGIEAQLRWGVAPHQWLQASYSRLRGDNKDLNEPLYQMPADELSLGWEGRVLGDWSADTTLRMVARQDRVATRFSNGSENPTAGFATLDVGTTWRYARGQSLRLAIRNLADKGYHEHLTEGVSGQEIQAPGRSLQLTWQGRF